ncbi:MAG: hypothetical protein ABII64_00110 [Elusimicrobiota bacterium]
MKTIKWICFTLYAALTIFVFYMVFVDAQMPRWWFFSRMQTWQMQYKVLFAVLFFLSQAGFVLTTMTGGLTKPLGFIRLAVPGILGSFIVTTVLTALFATIEDLLGLQFGIDVFLDIIAMNWIVWFGFFYVRYHKNNRFRVLKNFTAVALASGILLLFASALAHLEVRSRIELEIYHPGTSTTLSVLAGLWIILWSLGPGVVSLFFNEKYERIYNEWKKEELEEKAF